MKKINVKQFLELRVYQVSKLGSWADPKTHKNN